MQKKKNKKQYSNNLFGKSLKFWDFIWNDDSLFSWILSIIVAFIIIKFIVYPVLGFILSTNYPVVAIVSGSMEHHISNGELMGRQVVPNICGNYFNSSENLNFEEFWTYCGDWYLERGITKSEFRDFPFKNGMNVGDVIVLRNPGVKNIKIGDVIVFIQPGNAVVKPIIHRVVNKTVVNGKIIFQTKGDHNEDSIKRSTYGTYLNEYDVKEEQVIGKSIFRIPFVGYVKILAYDAFVGVRGLFK